MGKKSVPFQAVKIKHCLIQDWQTQILFVSVFYFLPLPIHFSCHYFLHRIGHWLSLPLRSLSKNFFTGVWSTHWMSHPNIEVRNKLKNFSWSWTLKIWPCFEQVGPNDLQVSLPTLITIFYDFCQQLFLEVQLKFFCESLILQYSFEMCEGLSLGIWRG